jgi:lipopolysaccharide biosynthesis glycosyltransferase
MIPNLEPNLDKVLYIDTDIIVVDDIKKLYEQDLEKYALGAINESYLFLREPQPDRFALPWHSKFTTVFNAGVMVFDIKKFKQQNIVEKLFETTKQNQDKICGDQDVFNIVFKDNFKMLDTKFNNMTTNLNYLKSINKTDEIKIEEEKTIIRHYNTGEKPWNSKDTFNANWFWYYASKTEFYEILKSKYDETIKDKMPAIAKKYEAPKPPLKTTTIKIKIKLFGVIPLLKIKRKANKVKIYLFDFIMILKIKRRES